MFLIISHPSCCVHSLRLSSKTASHARCCHPDRVSHTCAGPAPNYFSNLGWYFCCSLLKHQSGRHNNTLIITQSIYSFPLNGQGHAYEPKFGFEQITNLHGSKANEKDMYRPLTGVLTPLRYHEGMNPHRSLTRISRRAYLSLLLRSLAKELSGPVALAPHAFPTPHQRLDFGIAQDLSRGGKEH